MPKQSTRAVARWGGRAVWLPVVAAVACSPARTVRPPAPVPVPVNPPDLQLEPPAPPAPVGLDAKVDPAWIDRAMATLSLREKVGQLIMPWVGGDYMAVGTPGYERLRDWVQNQGIGGVVVSIGAPLELAQKLNMLQRMAKVPILVASDVEHGAGMRLEAGTAIPYGLDLGSATKFPPLMAFGAAGDEKLAYELGRITARESRAAGIHVAFAPVVDVNNNPANPIINVRSFGADPQAVARLAAADVRGLQAGGLFATAKHFPGHGDTGVDSHLALPVLTVDRARADAVELVPFRAALKAGVTGVMSAHIAFPALTGDTVPATLNPQMLSGLLERDLGFKGMVYTDALDMGGIVTKYGNADAAVLALKAGADVLLMPPDIPVAIDAVVAAVGSGQLSEARIDQSVRKVLWYKAQLGLDRQRTVDLAQIPYVVGVPAHLAVAEQAAQKGLTVGRDRDHLLPVDPARAKRVLSIVYSDDANPYEGRAFQAGLRERFPNLQTVLLNGATPQPLLDSLLAAADSADVVFFSPFVRVLARKGDVAVEPGVAAFARKLIARRPTVVTSFGSPYLLSEFPDAGTYVLAWGPEDVMQRAAARGLTGLAPITGKLPIPIPPYLPLGAGVTVGASAAAGATK
ncbi:MAG TPA: glycoside hydrolase family 3 N-terminal domain-containing protein [Longimicrobiales bacterium]|nr:glycoside hydrolase family 3 N-terminal domain-containing protein [Longimicrobiales bacterium]